MIDPADISNWTVLLVEDDPDNTALAEQILSFQGVTVITAEDGVEGLEVLKNVKPTVVLLDLAMPKMDGWQMFSLVRDNPLLTDVPIIAVTAHAMPEYREKALEAGFDGYITKPYSIRTFVQEIQTCLMAFLSENGAKEKQNKHE